MLLTVSYKELSAWIMSGALILAGSLYAFVLNAVWKETGEWVVPLVPFVAMTVVLIFLSIFGHLIGALFTRSRANDVSDERDKAIRQKSGNISGNILGASVLMVLLGSLMNQNAFLLFHAVFACVLMSQIAEYVLQIVFYRQTSFSGDLS